MRRLLGALAAVTIGVGVFFHARVSSRWSATRQRRHWGATCAPAFDCGIQSCASPSTLQIPCPAVNSPQGPGMQSRFQCPGPGTTNTSTGQACTASRRSRQRFATAAHCRDWFGVSTVVLACSPTKLRHGLRTGGLGRTGRFSLARNRQRGHHQLAALAQLGGNPLAPGESVTLAGRYPRDTQLFVRASTRRTLVEARFDPAQLRRSRRVTALVVLRPALSIELRLASGRRLTPAQTRRIKLPPIGSTK
jgi:hypothetical protein